MGKKKGKGKSQAQAGTGDQPTSEPSSSAQTPSTSQEPSVPQEQQKWQTKQRKGQQELASASPSGPESPSPQEFQQKAPRQQKQRKGQHDQPSVSPPQQESPVTPQEPQQRGPRQQKQQKGQKGQGPPQGRPQQYQQQPQQPQQPQQWRTPQSPTGGPSPQQPLPQFYQQGFAQQQMPRGPLPFPPQMQQPPPHWGPPPIQMPHGPQGPQFAGPSQPPQVSQWSQRGPAPVGYHTAPPGMGPQSPVRMPPQQPPLGTVQQLPSGMPQPGMLQKPPPGYEPPVPLQQQQPPQQIPPRKPQQQRQHFTPRQQQQPPRPQPQEKASPAKDDQSPPFGGQGDCLKQLALVTPGTKGRVIKVESNHLSLTVGKILEAVHYDVTITPDTPKSLLRDVMNVFGKKHYPNRHPAFDGRKNLYSPNMLPFGETVSDVIKVEGENRTKEFKVEIKFARTVDLSPLHDMLKTKTSPQDALQCLDIVLRNAPSNTCITAGRCFFTPPSDQIIQLGDGMEMYYGFYQSAIRGWKPLLNVDVAHKAFPSALNLLDVICELGSDYRTTMTRNDLGRPLNEFLIKNLEKFIKTLKVKYEITGQSSSKRIYRVNGLGSVAARAEFKLEDGSTTTVQKYFQNVKRCSLKYPHLPTLWVGAKDRDSKILLPLEFCSVVEGQTINRKMNENQTSAMIKKSATSTQERKKKIMASLRTADFNNDPCIREFGFSISNQFEKLDARVLHPPSLQYAGNSVVNPTKGVWNAMKSKFLVGAVVKKWTIACVTRQPCRVEQLANDIYRMAATSGMQMEAKAMPPFVHVGGRQGLQDITEYFRNKQDYDLIFVVVPNSGPQYSFVKKAAELNVGCLTQCIKERTLNRLNPQTVANILLKINSKMNGKNHTFSQPSRPPIMSRPCMIMGADVTHPSPDAKDIPSVAAVTASHDPKAFQYNICWRLQPPKMEIIEDLCNITKEQLMFFYRATGCKPERIIFFRDGVSEGQFSQVQRAEINAIQQACRQLQADNYQPAITFLVVQKRHHTRLFPLDPKDSEDRNMNVPAGTCVDTIITNPTMQDFYLVSHASIQGVAKPTKYCTLWDDNNMTNDDIEELTYHLCHMFTRCNRSVSYPAPTYYAHLAAARAKVYIENDRLNMGDLKRHQQSYQIKECIIKNKPMFFV